MKVLKRIGKVFGILIGILVIALAAALVFFTVREYRPKETEAIEVSGEGKSLKPGDSLSILSYNTGYGGLDASEDFFMDGGTNVQPKSKEAVQKNIEGISSILKEQDCDVYFLQEVDRDSKRSYYIDEEVYYEEQLGIQGMFACNFKCDFVPYPLPPIGKVDSGILTLTSLSVSEANRLSLPESFSWPVKTCNLKRCMLESRIRIEGTDAELVLINFHLEAYDDGEGKEAQTKILAQKLESEYEAGNYVIAGGDFNQTFDVLEEKYPLVDEENWAPGTISADSLPEHFSFALDDTYPTCRLLKAPYTNDYETSQVYVIDGFIVSDNLQVTETQVINTDFTYADHQPVRLEVTLK